MKVRLGDAARSLAARLRGLARRDDLERRMDEEVAFHLEMETERNVQAGMPPEAARRAARLAFGGVERVREEVRDEQRIELLDVLVRHTRHAMRAARRAPAFSTVVVATLSLGVAASTTIFGVLDATLLRPLAFPEADRLVHVGETTPEGSDFSASEPNYLDFRDGNRTLAGLAAWRLDARTMTGRETPHRVRVLAATHDLPRVLGIEPVRGRWFAPDEDRPGANGSVALLGERFWRERWAADPGVIGSDVVLDGEPHVVVGIVPAIRELPAAELWVPLAPDAAADRGDHWLDMIGRLAPGATQAEVEADLGALAAAIGASHPEVAGWGVRIRGFREWRVGPELRRTAWLVSGAVLLLLLTTCVNVAGLVLARASARRSELGTRLALGSGRKGLVSLLVAETAFLAVAGGAIGLAGAAGALALVRRLPADLTSRLGSIELDLRVAAFAAGTVALSTLLAGALPALGASRVRLDRAMRPASRGGVAGRARLREALVVGQVALAVVLGVVAGLMLRSLREVDRVDAGFRTESVWAVPIQLPEAGYAEPWQKAAFYRSVREEILGVPGVTAVGGTAIRPWGDLDTVNDVTPEGRAHEAPSSGLSQAAWRIVTPGYFEAAGIPLRRGRLFSAVDRHDGPPVAVVTEAFATRLWPGEDPVGKRFFWGGTTGTPRTVVGVVGDIRDMRLEAEPRPTMFLSTRQITWPTMTWLVRTSGPLDGLEDSVREAVWRVDPNLAVPEVTPLEASRSGATAGRRVQTLAISAFGAAAVLLAALGVYGVLAFSVAQRSREIGVRRALGARAGEVLTMVAGQGLGLAAMGALVGLGGALALGPVLEATLYGTTARDPVAYIAVLGAVGAATLLAAAIPAWRAARTSPRVALEGE